MLPENRDLAFLWDILKAARLIQHFIADVDEKTFSQDMKTHFAVIAQLQIIGEATKRLSDEFRTAHPTIPWKNMAGMRDILIHMYDQIDLFEVWKVITVSIPQLVEYLEPLLPPEPSP